MQIDRPRADGAAAGQRDLGLAMPRQQRPQHLEAGAHLAHHVVGGEGGSDLARPAAASRRPRPAPAPRRRPRRRRSCCSSSAMARTSASRGMLVRVSGSAVSSDAAISLSAAFLAPLMGISPVRRRPPRMRIRSMVPHSRVMPVSQRAANSKGRRSALRRGRDFGFFLRCWRVSVALLRAISTVRWTVLGVGRTERERRAGRVAIIRRRGCGGHGPCGACRLARRAAASLSGGVSPSEFWLRAAFLGESLRYSSAPFVKLSSLRGSDGANPPEIPRMPQ